MHKNIVSGFLSVNFAAVFLFTKSLLVVPSTAAVPQPGVSASLALNEQQDLLQTETLTVGLQIEDFMSFDSGSSSDAFLRLSEKQLGPAFSPHNHRIVESWESLLSNIDIQETPGKHASSGSSEPQEVQLELSTESGSIAWDFPGDLLSEWRPAPTSNIFGVTPSSSSIRELGVDSLFSSRGSLSPRPNVASRPTAGSRSDFGGSGRGTGSQTRTAGSGGLTVGGSPGTGRASEFAPSPNQAFAASTVGAGNVARVFDQVSASLPELNSNPIGAQAVTASFDQIASSERPQLTSDGKFGIPNHQYWTFDFNEDTDGDGIFGERDDADAQFGNYVTQELPSLLEAANQVVKFSPVELESIYRDLNDQIPTDSPKSPDFLTFLIIDFPVKGFYLPEASIPDNPSLPTGAVD